MNLYISEKLQQHDRDFWEFGADTETLTAAAQDFKFSQDHELVIIWWGLSYLNFNARE